MKLTVVMGFFLPMPPALGGATEKTWSRLARELSTRGHEITIISRSWPGFPATETLQGVRHLRYPGFAHRRKLWQNLVLDFIWSQRVYRRLPAADIVVVHAVALPVWLGRLKPRAGRVVLMPGRMPKGQYGHYRRIGRVLATSTPVRERVLIENPALAPVTHVYGYPIAWESLSRPRPAASRETVIGYVGRLHPEKGVDLLAAAAIRLQAESTLPAWRLLLCGPDDVPAGGAGERYRRTLEEKLRQNLPEHRWSLRPAINHEEALASLYRSVDIFCYPSLAEAGETFGVAVAEAMAAGTAPVVSSLACFRDFVRPDANGLVFDHAAPDAAGQLAAKIAGLVRDPARRRSLAAAAQADVRRYDFSVYVEKLAGDFGRLLVETVST